MLVPDPRSVSAPPAVSRFVAKRRFRFGLSSAVELKECELIQKTRSPSGAAASRSDLCAGESLEVGGGAYPRWIPEIINSQDVGLVACNGKVRGVEEYATGSLAQAFDLGGRRTRANHDGKNAAPPYGAQESLTVSSDLRPLPPF